MLIDKKNVGKLVNVNIGNKKAFFQLFIMIGLTILTQIVSILKTSTVASQFGAYVEMDAFNFSNNIGTFIFSFIGGGITTVLIPNLMKKNNEEGINIFISFLYTVAFAILMCVYFLRKLIVRGLSSGNDEFISISCNIMIITLITQYLNSFLGATNAIFQCRDKFNLPKLINLITTIILVGLIICMPRLTIYKYAFYILITSVTNVIIQIYLVIKDGYKFKYKLDINNGEFKKMFKVFLPTVLSSGLYQFSLVIDTIISSNLGEGNVSILSYSNTLMIMVDAILLSNLMMYLYPKIAKSINNDNSQEKMFDLMILLNGIMILIVIEFFIVGKDGIALLYERGKFTSQITKFVYLGTLLYMLGIPTNAMRDLVYRYFYAKGDTITPFKNSVIVSVINIIVSIIMSRYVGVYGIIIGTVLTSYLSLAMILIRFNKKFKIKYSIFKLIIENIKIIVNSIIVIKVMSWIVSIVPISNLIVRILIYGSITTILYGIILLIFRSKVLKIKL